MKKVLTIAGSDSSGGAGIQADLKTMTVNKVYGMSVITAITAQNTLGVHAVHELPSSIIEEQLKAVFDDMKPDVIKIGMLSNKENIEIIAKYILKHPHINVVLDPVMISTSGKTLLETSAINTLIEVLFPLTTLITPNIPEAEYLSGVKIKTEKDMLYAAKLINAISGSAVLLKGGHFDGEANDLYYKKPVVKWFRQDRFDNSNTHGTGCTLSSAIACNLAKDQSLIMSIQNAKSYISKSIQANLNLGKGNGPLNHMF